ncbi:MAG: DNRLRE domain-containing protein, partial [Chloroflexi bacterium]|nr:DNRLRE domain-containing protein [Chloroflexota bacterium]
MKKRLLFILPLSLLALLTLLLPHPTPAASRARPQAAPQAIEAAPGAWSVIWRGSGAVRDMTCPTPDICYAVGDAGLFLKTTDRGQTWRFQALDDENTDLLGVAFADANRGLIVGQNGRTFRTDDAGETWRMSATPTAVELRAVSLLADGRAWVAAAGGAIFHSADWGATWAAQTSNTTQNLNAIQFLDANTGFAVGDKGVVLRTTDGGATWAALDAGFPAWANIYALHFTSSNEGWIAGQAGMMRRTQNGGDAWTEVASGVEDDILDIHFGGGVGAFAAEAGAVATSSDGLTWTQRTTRVAGARTATAVFALGPDNIWAAGLVKPNPDNGARAWWIRHSADGLSFQRSAGDFGPYAHLYDAAYPSKDVIYAVGDESAVGISTDRGETWRWMSLRPDGDESSNPYFLAVSCTDEQTCWVGGRYGRVYKTADGGRTWTAQLLPGGGRPVYDIQMVTDQIGYVGSNFDGAGKNGLFYTEDGGETWIASGADGTNPGVDISMVNPTDGWMAVRNFSYRYTTNAGRYWRRVINTDLAQGIYIAVQALDDDQDGAVDKVWLAGCQGPLVNEECQPAGKVVYSEDAGATWTYQALPDDAPPLNDVHMFDAQKGWLAGEDGALLYTNNGGASWELVASGLGEGDDIQSLAFADPSRGVAAAFGGHLLRFTGPGRTLGAYSQDGAITIDGLPDDWYLGGALAFDATNADSVLGPEPHPAPDELGADLFSRFTGDSLYVLAEIQDDVVAAGDAFYLAIDGLDDNLWNGDDDHLLVIRADGVFSDTLHPDQTAGIDVGVRESANGWVAEIRLDAAALARANLAPGHAVGFNVALDDDDGQGVEHTLVMHGKRVDENPATFGTIRLLDNTLVYRMGLDGYDAASDTFLERWYDQTGNTPRGDDPELKIIYNVGMVFIDSILRFELTGLPDQAQILEATLDLVATNVKIDEPLTLSVYRLLKPWDERTATWNQPMPGQSWGAAGAMQPGADYDPAALESKTISDLKIGDHLQFDVSAAVQSWREGASENHGILLLPEGGKRYLFFGSSQNSSESKRPSLIVRYRLQPRPSPTPTPGPTATPTPTPTPT